jgi:phenylpyruvate tautomerase PptA (4-oxalocrotonate tautomerase family)
MKYTQTEQRQIARSATRSQLRRNGTDPETVTVAVALMALDEISRRDSSLVASIWYAGASENQIRLFKMEWVSND